jgi:hypothetical protein
MEGFMMKKLKMFAILPLLAVLVLVVGCGASRKDPIGESEFISIVEQAGFTVYDISSDYAEISSISRYIVAKKGDYQVELIIAANNSDAENIFNQQKTIDEQGSGTKTSSSSGNKGRYTVTTSSSYRFGSRIGNTFVYANEESQYKDAIKEIVEALGY